MVKLLNSEDVDEFLKEMKETYYGKYMYAADNTTFEYAYHHVMSKMHIRDYRENPFSLASVTTYLYLKDEEVKKLITIAECIRYKYSPEKIINTLNTIGGAG
jgi:V/A-type H+-transporting ATPase subunit C